MSADVTRGEYVISTDRARLPVAQVHRWLHDESYWAKDIPLDVVQTSVLNSLNFGLYHGDALVGFARVVTDYATFAYVGDVFVLAEHRGRGLSKWLMATIAADPRLAGFRRWILATRDAHGLYAQAGYAPLAQPDRWMEWRPVMRYAGPPRESEPPPR
jgi:GNAT superfamily N-acetyltransferase